MACPVCASTERTEINVRVKQESDLKQIVGSTWDGRNMARCDGCGVLYDHRYAESGDGEDTSETVNCPECGSPNAGDRAICSYCESELDPSTG